MKLINSVVSIYVCHTRQSDAQNYLIRFFLVGEITLNTHECSIWDSTI